MAILITAVYAPSIVVTGQYNKHSSPQDKRRVGTHGVPSGPVIYADMNKEGH